MMPSTAAKRVPVILLVEDNPADVKILQRALNQGASSAELVVVRDGQEAVEYLTRQGSYAPVAASPEAGAAVTTLDKKRTAPLVWRSPDLILLDLNLPRMTGREVLEHIRSSSRYGNLPVIVLSTSRRPEDVEEAYAAGANTYIEKPAEFERFVEVLRLIQKYWLETAQLPPCSGV